MFGPMNASVVERVCERRFIDNQEVTEGDGGP